MVPNPNFLWINISAESLEKSQLEFMSIYVYYNNNYYYYINTTYKTIQFPFEWLLVIQFYIYFYADPGPEDIIFANVSEKINWPNPLCIDRSLTAY